MMSAPEAMLSFLSEAAASFAQLTLNTYRALVVVGGGVKEAL